MPHPRKYLWIFSLAFFLAGCAFSSRQFVVGPDESDMITYVLESGEVGGEGTRLIIQGNG